MKSFINKLIPKELLQGSLKSFSPRKLFLVKQLRIFTLAFKGFGEDKVKLRASALTYYTMFSIVPVIALAFGIANGFGFGTFLEEQIMENFSGHEKVLEWILGFVQKYLLKIRGGVIAGVGIVVLLWSVMKLLGNIESSFNDIWQIKKSRVISRKISDYVSLVVITPVLLFVSSSVTIFLANEIKHSSEFFPLLSYIGPVLSFFVSLIPYVLIWLIFTLLYIVMPNTKVKFKSAFIGGVIAGTIFQLLQWGYIYFQGSITSYGAIYGSFAALPLFLIWMQLSWLIVLLGAEISFANQNVEHYETESESINISNHLRRTFTMLILKEIILTFKNGETPMTAEQLAKKMDFPVRIIREIIYELQETGIISETVTKSVKESAYQPAQDIDNLTIAYVIDLLDKRGNDTLFMGDSKELAKMMKVVDGFMNEIKASKNNKLIYELG